MPLTDSVLLRNLCNLWITSWFSFSHFSPLDVKRCHSLACDNRQLDKARLVRRVIDTLRCFLIIVRHGPADVRHEGLRVAIVNREPARRDWDHDPVTRQEDMVSGW